jgi:hypothetical protein
MEHTMKLHEDKTLFTQLLNFSANALNIRPEFIEKDYWLTRVLQWHKTKMQKAGVNNKTQNR